MEDTQDAKFILTLKDKLKIEEQRANLRMTPKGLFVRETFKSQIADHYNHWIEQISGEKIKRSNEKTQHKLFGAEDSAKLCLIEGKETFLGSILECPSQDIQRYKLPTYLGSLVSTRDYLHPNDPIFNEKEGILYKPNNQGGEVHFKTVNGVFKVPFNSIKNYRTLLLTSRRVKKDFPELEGTLNLTLKVLKHLFSKARLLRRTEPVIVPQRGFGDRKLEYWFVGHFVFIVENRISTIQTVVQTYFLKDESLYDFMREEFEQLEKESRTKWFESFHFAPSRYLSEKHKFLGELVFPNNKYFLTSHAFKQYIESVLEGNVEHKRYKGLFTIKNAIRNFFEAFKLARLIEYRLVKNIVPEKFTAKYDYRMAEGLVFVVTMDGDIEGCVCRYGK